MSFTLRAKRTLVGALAMTMVISLMPAGVASAFEEEKEAVCMNAGDSGFTDLAGSVHADNIECMAAYGIGSGFTDGTFRPGTPITRDQMATLLTTFAVVATDEAVLDLIDEDIEVPFTDIEGNVHAGAIEALYRLGIVSGQTDTTYNPRGLVTRAQYASFVVQAHEALGVDFDELLDEVDSPFTDIEGNVHESNIETLFSANLVVGQTPTTYNPGGNVQRGQVMTVLANSAGVLELLGIWAAPRLDPPVEPTPDAESFTAAPELLRVRSVGTNVLAWDFDADIPGLDQSSADWRLYQFNGDYTTPTELSRDGMRTILTRFDTNALTTAVRAGVRTNGVEAATGLPNLAGDWPLRAFSETDQVDPLDPDLVRVNNYSFNSVVIGGVNYVLVDFVFENTTTLPWGIGDTFEEFFLVGEESQRFEAIPAGDVDFTFDDVVTTEGTTTTVSVPFAVNPEEVPEEQLRRGYVFIDDSTDGTPLVLSEGYGTTGGVTVDPDLISVERESANTYRFQFNEAVSAAAGSIVQDAFWLFDEDGVGVQSNVAARSAIAADNAEVVRVQFTGLTDDFDPVKGAVIDGAVLATDSQDSDNDGRNRTAAVNVTPPPPTTITEDFGATELPDLQSVTKIQNQVTGRYTVQFNFDSSVAGLSVSNTEFAIYDQAGTRIRITSGGVFSGSTATFSSEASSLTDTQIAAARAATVQSEADSEVPPGDNAVTPEAKRGFGDTVIE